MRRALAILACAAASLAGAQEPSPIARAAAAIVMINDADTAQGSGFAVSADGLIVTNLHVVAPMRQPRVTLASGESFGEVRVVGYDRERDLAVLKIPASGLPALALGQTSDVRVGRQVVALGAPWGLSGTATVGIISAIRRHPTLHGARMLQTDAAINPGNSGGPLINERGEVLGVVVSRMQGAHGLGFAVPVEDLRGLLRSSEYAFTLDELRRYLLHTDWAGAVLPRRWRANGDLYLSTAKSALYELDARDALIRLTLLRPEAESRVASKLVLSLARDGQRYEGQASGEVTCETLREGRRLSWQQPSARIAVLSPERIEISFLAPSPPEAEGDCQLRFREHSVALEPAGALEDPPGSGESEILEGIRARRVAEERRRVDDDRRRAGLRRDCPDVKAKIARECAQLTQWNTVSCKTYDDVAAVCRREGF